jgi:hypothetical protein
MLKFPRVSFVFMGSIVRCTVLLVAIFHLQGISLMHASFLRNYNALRSSHVAAHCSFTLLKLL